MRYKIKDLDTQKEYYRKKIPRKVPHNIQNGIISEVIEQLRAIGYIQNGEKTVLHSLREENLGT